MKRKAVRQRLDHLLVERSLATSAQKAQAMILAGEVQVDGQPTQKAGAQVIKDAKIEITSRLQKFASRGGRKLEGALHDFAVSPTGLVCLDVGASNGGFTDCLLQNGAARVYALDVNIDQLDWKLAHDARVIAIQRNAREVRIDDISEPVDLVAVDVSFISVRKIVTVAAAVAKPGGIFLILVKPQFELPRQDIPTGGIVRDKALHEKAIASVRDSLDAAGLDFLAVRPSHLLGAEGNQEYFLHARKKALG